PEPIGTEEVPRTGAMQAAQEMLCVGVVWGEERSSDGARRDDDQDDRRDHRGAVAEQTLYGAKLVESPERALPRARGHRIAHLAKHRSKPWGSDKPRRYP